MRYRNLLAYIEQKNAFRGMCGAEQINLPLTQDQINEIADDIDCDMSPENLCCDGEISSSQAGLKAGKLCRAFSELKQHAKDQGLSITVKTYEVS